MDNKMKDTNIGMKVEGESLARKPTPEEHKLMQLEQESANPPAKNSGSKQEKKSEKKSDDNDESSAEDKGYEEFDWEDLQRSFEKHQRSKTCSLREESSQSR